MDANLQEGQEGPPGVPRGPRRAQEPQGLPRCPQEAQARGTAQGSPQEPPGAPRSLQDTPGQEKKQAQEDRKAEIAHQNEDAKAGETPCRC